MVKTMIISRRVTYILIAFVVVLAMRFAYKYSPRRIEFFGNYHKVWAHRVNSIEKLNAALGHFRGVELDLIYVSHLKTLDVRHPPALTIDLTFEKYLDAIPKDNSPFLWLDIKNLTSENASEIFKRISFLLKEKRYPIKKLLIESQHPEALELFNDAGFQTSYYLPVGLSKKSTFELDLAIDTIQLALSKNKKMGVSSSYLDYEIMSKFFPERQKYVWKIDGLTFTNYSQTRKILKDTTVKVVLSRFQSFKGNR